MDKRATISPFEVLCEIQNKNILSAVLIITARPVLDAINTAIGGREVGHVYDGVRKFPIVTRLSEDDGVDIYNVRYNITKFVAKE